MLYEELSNQSTMKIQKHRKHYRKISYSVILQLIFTPISSKICDISAGRDESVLEDMRQTRQKNPIRAKDKRTGSEDLSRIQVIHRAVGEVMHGRPGAQPASIQNKLPRASEVHFQPELRQKYQSLAEGKGLEP